MKYAYLFGIIIAMASLFGCNQPNNGEVPPPGELPTPYPTQSATSPATTTPAPAASTMAPASSASASGNGQGKQPPATVASTH